MAPRLSFSVHNQIDAMIKSELSTNEIVEAVGCSDRTVQRKRSKRQCLRKAKAPSTPSNPFTRLCLGILTHHHRSCRKIRWFFPSIFRLNPQQPYGNNQVLLLRTSIYQAMVVPSKLQNSPDPSSLDRVSIFATIAFTLSLISTEAWSNPTARAASLPVGVLTALPARVCRISTAQI